MLRFKPHCNLSRARILVKQRSSIVSRSLHISTPCFEFKKRVEEDIRYLIDSLPAPSRIYQNEDGTARQPSDLELHKIAQLSLLNSKRKLRIWEYFTLNEKDLKLYSDNYSDIIALLPSEENGATGDIIDKIPFENPDGTIKWKIVRENENEGWEKISYYGLVPGLLLLVGVHLFKDNDGIDEWAAHELKLRVLEQEGQSTAAAEDLLNDRGKTHEELRKRDNLIVERILSGEYDKLSNLQLRKPPTLSLIGDISQDLAK